MELADQQNLEAEGAVSGAEIPVSPEPASPAASSSSAPEKPLSLRDQINKSVEAVRKEEATRARDTTTGKFAKVEKPEASAADTPAANEIPSTTEAKPLASTPDAPPPIWKGVWEKLPEDVRALAVKRETEVAKGFDEYRTKTAQLTEISQALDPIRPVLQQNGITSDAQAVKTLLQWEGSFRNPQTRMAAFHNLARQYGVDLSTLAQNSSQAPSTVQDIPEPLRPVIDQFGSLAQSVQTIQQRLDQTDAQRTQGEIAAFAKDKPHFEVVRTIMGQLMSAGTAKDLESAYQQATRIHPEVSAKLEAERVAKEASELNRTQVEKANKARLAAISPAGRSPNGAPVNGGTAKTSKGVRGDILASIQALREEQRA